MRIESGALDARNSAQIDPKLRHLINRWHDLPDQQKQHIIDTVKRHAKTPDADAHRQAVLDALKRAHESP